MFVSLLSLYGEEPCRILIDKPALTLSIMQGQMVLHTFPIACGKNLGQKQNPGDMRTPEGNFTITEIINSRSWTHDFGDGKGKIRGAYGPWFFRLSYGHGIGIHGTHEPESMGKRVSEGCVRLRNADIEKLRSLVSVGTRVQILPDTLVNN